ncbi:MAG: MBOAT family protein [Deferribacteres bacterium]|nr:MBOAT family protein [candidate division KSB1 bacterium]MCB9501641.1 MBOAT family protein [Deferribacteres bacterium]
MWFNSWEFLYFLPTVLAIYYSLNKKAQNLWLLVASYFFYGWWDWRFLSLVFASTLVDYFAGLYIQNQQAPSTRRLGLYASLFMNLGALCLFKYFNFFVDSFTALGDSFGLNFNTPVLRLLPPVGISFYTFQTLSYTIDVYRNRQEPVRNFIDFALYVTYFPQLVAGPIERATALLPQIQKKRIVTLEQFQAGCLLILIGLFKKIALADAAAPLVEEAFANPQAQSSIILLKGLYLFSLQIYCDFSGYSSIARGVSKLIGIELSENFQTPYLATNITDFWRRWHITLSRWLRDYLYIPLGGNRLGKTRTYINLMLTMLIGGLWHGANWTFVVWGGLHGFYLAAHKKISEIRRTNTKKNAKLSSTILTVLKTVTTFHLVALTWIFFRSPDFTTACNYLTGILRWHGGFPLSYLKLPILLFALLAPIEWLQSRRFDVLAITRLPVPVRALYYVVMIIALILLGGNDVPFIYFQF